MTRIREAILGVDDDGRFYIGDASGNDWNLLNAIGGPIIGAENFHVTRPRKGETKTWVTTDAINGQQVHFRSKGIYASVLDDIERLGFIAKTIGDVGNEISVEYVDAVGEDLKVNVNGKSIIVHLQTTSEPTTAVLETSFDGINNDLIFRAKTPGSDGNNILINYNTDPGTEDTTASLTDDAINVELEMTDDVPAVAATLHDTSNGVVYTMIVPGSAGNAMKLLVWNGSSDNPVRFETFGAYSVNLDVDGSVVTVAEFVDQINAHSGSPFSAELDEGNDGSALVSRFHTGLPDDQYQFSGGEDLIPGTVLATAEDVKNAVESDSDSNALVSVEYAPENDGGGVVSSFGEYLDGGSDAGTDISTAEDVKTAIKNNNNADNLVEVILQSDGDMSIGGPYQLSGGDDDLIVEGSVSLA